MLVERRSDKQEPDKELLAQMRQSLGLLQVAFDSASDAMVILDHHHTIRWANKTAADRFSHGLTATLISKPFENQITLLTPYGEAMPLDSKTLFLNQKGGNKRLRVTGINPNPDHKAPLNTVSWETITNTNDPFHLVSFRDLDPIERALEQERLFVQQLAHELRTPLALLSGSLRKLSRLVSAPNQAINALQTAQAESQRLKTLVDNLMLLSDLETDLFPWSIQKQCLKASIQKWIDHLPRHQQHQINVIIEPNLENIRFDSHALTIILDQLLDNSLRFSDNTASITITVKYSSKGVSLLFADTGPGIADTSLDKATSIFERFHRLEQHRSRTRPEGCGLGLTVVQKLIEHIGGSVEILNQSKTLDGDYLGACIAIHFNN